MPWPDGPADGTSIGATTDLWDPHWTQLLNVCGEHLDLVVETAFQVIAHPYRKLWSPITRYLMEQKWKDDYLWLRALERALQGRYVDCHCSPFDRLMRKHAIISGSMAEGLSNLPRPPKYQSTSDMDIMVELGPVHWTSLVPEKIGPVESTAGGRPPAATANPSSPDSDPVPRLAIVETENPGFVLVLQERREDCPHQERRPFRAEAVTQLFRDYQTVAMGENVTHCYTKGPACSFKKPTTETCEISDFDEVACLHVPVWWFSDEFFARHRRYNWPPKLLRRDIRQNGLHLVPVGAPGSDTEKIEWRLSFSRAELVLISQLTDMQRCSAIAFKICRAALGGEGNVIKSYFVKTALLWQCEETPTEEWTSVIQGVLKLLDFLDEAVIKNSLPCFFWSRINLFQFCSRTDQKAMKKALGDIRHHLTRFLVREVCLLNLNLQKMLAGRKGRLSEFQLRVRLTRWVIVTGVRNITVRHMARFAADSLLEQSYTPDEVRRLRNSCNYWRLLQQRLYQALAVAPINVYRQVRFFSSVKRSIHVRRDAAPLLALLTERDLKKLLGDPDAVRAWLRRHHQVPETERSGGTLHTDLDRCDLLLDTPLMIRILKRAVPHKYIAYKKRADELPHSDAKLLVPDAEKASHETRQLSAQWRKLSDDLQVKLGLERQTALRMAHDVGIELQQLCEDPETLAEHDRTRRCLSDPWHLSHFFLGDSP